LLPSEVPAGTKKPKWWLCSKGHEWNARPSDITRKPDASPCPFCAGRRIQVGFNDLASQHPNIAQEWHPEKNGTLTAQEVTFGSAQLIWWKGSECGHEWQDQIAERTRERHAKGCKICFGYQILKGFNDLATARPDVAQYWHSTKNTITAEEVLPGSRAENYWWLGDCGHEWEAPCSRMTHNKKTGTGCPYCAGKKTLVGFNDLTSQRPEVASEWHPNLNGTLLPVDVTPGSTKNVWWRCPNGHEWEETVASRARKGRSGKCRHCRLVRTVRTYPVPPKTKKEPRPKVPKKPTNKVPPVIYEELTETRLIEEWHPTKNRVESPIGIELNMASSAWWLCLHGHEWKQQISRRLNGTVNGEILGCPTCTGRRFLSGFNDLGTTHPALATEWHPTLNGDVLPSDIQYGSNTRFWWLCSLGHEWKVTPNGRVKSGTGCPTCCGRVTLAGFNDLATTRPDIAAEWHPTKNGDLNPTDFTQWKNLKVWWQCKEKEHHEWEAAIYSRSDGRNCPHCINYQSKIEMALYDELKAVYHDAESGNRLPIKWGKSGCAHIDILLPSPNVIVEYDGWYWHKEKFTADTQKTTALIAAGYKVVRVRAKPLEFLDMKDDNLIQIVHDKETAGELADMVKKVL
jgi:hypothetical protein